MDHSRDKRPLLDHFRFRHGGAENAGVENAGRVDRTDGNCRSGKYGSENVWKTARTENKNSHQLVIQVMTQNWNNYRRTL